jgi:hypothetical protein
MVNQFRLPRYPPEAGKPRQLRYLRAFKCMDTAEVLLHSSSRISDMRRRPA